MTLNDDNLVTDASVEQEMSLSLSHFPYGNTWVEDEERWEYLTGFDASLKAAVAAINSGLRGLWGLCALDRAAFTVHTRDGRDLTLPGPYLADGRLDHAYALTLHKSQGRTSQITLAAAPSITRETAQTAHAIHRSGAHQLATDLQSAALAAAARRPQMAGLALAAQPAGHEAAGLGIGR